EALDDGHLGPRALHRSARAIVHVGERLAALEVAPEARFEPGLALDGVVQEIVHEVASRLTVDLFLASVVADDLEHVPLVGDLAKADVHGSAPFRRGPAASRLLLRSGMQIVPPIAEMVLRYV